jgi:hypothetical protein
MHSRALAEARRTEDGAFTLATVFRLASTLACGPTTRASKRGAPPERPLRARGRRLPRRARRPRRDGDRGGPHRSRPRADLPAARPAPHPRDARSGGSAGGGGDGRPRGSRPGREDGSLHLHVGPGGATRAHRAGVLRPRLPVPDRADPRRGLRRPTRHVEPLGPLRGLRHAGDVHRPSVVDVLLGPGDPAGASDPTGGGVRLRSRGRIRPHAEGTASGPSRRVPSWASGGPHPLARPRRTSLP